MDDTTTTTADTAPAAEPRTEPRTEPAAPPTELPAELPTVAPFSEGAVTIGGLPVHDAAADELTYPTPARHSDPRTDDRVRAAMRAIDDRAREVFAPPAEAPALGLRGVRDGVHFNGPPPAGWGEGVFVADPARASSVTPAAPPLGSAQPLSAAYCAERAAAAIHAAEYGTGGLDGRLLPAECLMAADRWLALGVAMASHIGMARPRDDDEGRRGVGRGIR